MTNDLTDAIATIVGYLRAAGVDFMVVGSIAALAHGRARSTHDLDLVVEATSEALQTFVRSLPTDRFYASEDAAIEAAVRRSMFNVLDLHTGWKIDMILRRDREFSRAEFSRRMTLEVLGEQLPVATVEDTVIAKLEWARDGGGSARQLEDVKELLVVGAATLDQAYLDKWIDALSLRDLWDSVRGSGDDAD